MGIRNSSKALILHNGKLLLNRCTHEDGRVYYDLPGGGQDVYESMEDALVREVLEETGYSVRIIGYGGVAEEIFDDPVLRKQYPDYSHRILHLFRAELMSETREKASETDFSMQECQWIDLNEVQALSELVPHQLTEVLPELLNGNTPIYLGTIRYDWIAP